MEHSDSFSSVNNLCPQPAECFLSVLHAFTVLSWNIFWYIQYTRCVNQCSVAVKRPHPWPWQLLEKKAFKWDFLTGSEVSPLLSWWRAWWHTHSQTRCWRSNWNSTPRSIGSRKRETLGLAWAFETPKSTTHDTLHLLIPVKSYHFLITKHSNTWAYGSHAYSNHHTRQCATIKRSKIQLLRLGGCPNG